LGSRAKSNLRKPSFGISKASPLLPHITVRHCSNDPKDMEQNHLKDSHEQIFVNNRKWVAQQLEEDPQFFEKLESGQAPEYL
jgi:hypothetical protein